MQKQKLTLREAVEKLDHTICMNINLGTIKFGIDKYQDGPNGTTGCDCESIDEAIECIEMIEKAIVDFDELKKGIQWRKEHYKRDLDRGCDPDGEKLTKTNKLICMNLYNIMIALESYYKDKEEWGDLIGVDVEI